MKIKITHINGKWSEDNGVKVLIREDFDSIEQAVGFYRDHEYQFVMDDKCACTEQQIESGEQCKCVTDDDVLKVIDQSPVHALAKWYDMRFTLFVVIADIN